MMLVPYYAIFLPRVAGFSQVDTGHSTSNLSLCCGYQRRSFYAAGLDWQWWYDGANVDFATSADGSTWSGSTSVFATLKGDLWSVTFDGTQVHYARQYANAGKIYYRMGNPNSNGMITWSSAEQDTGVSGTTVTIAIDSFSHPWIGYRESSNGYPTVAKDNNTDGTWATAVGFPHVVSFSYAYATAVVLALSGGKMYVLYQNAAHVTLGTPYDGANWGTQETADTQPTLGSDWQSQTVIGDTIYDVFLKQTPFEVIALSRSSGGTWSGETAVTTLGAADMPIISHDDSGFLYIFYLNTPFSNYLSYKKSTSANSIASWNKAVDWINDDSNTLSFTYGINAYDHAGGGSIGVAFMDGANSPYNIEFQGLADSPTSPTYSVTLLAVILIGLTAALTANLTRGTRRQLSSR